MYGDATGESSLKAVSGSAALVHSGSLLGGLLRQTQYFQKQAVVDRESVFLMNMDEY